MEAYEITKDIYAIDWDKNGRVTEIELRTRFNEKDFPGYLADINTLYADKIEAGYEEVTFKKEQHYDLPAPLETPEVIHNQLEKMCGVRS